MLVSTFNYSFFDSTITLQSSVDEELDKVGL